MPSFCVYPSAAARLQQARAWLRHFHPTQQILIVGANADSANELVRGIASDGSTPATFGWRRTTLGRLAAEIAAQRDTAPGLVPVTRLVSEAVVTRVVHELGRDGRLGRYAPLFGRPGFARAVSAVIDELRLAGVAPDAAGEVAPELALIAERYAEALAKSGLADRALLFRLAAERIDAANGDWPACPTLLLDVPVWTSADQTLVGALARRTAEVLATCAAGDEETGRRLREAGFENVPGEGGVTVAPAIAHTQAHLFRDSRPRESAPEGDLVVLSAPGESRECVEIARQALAYAREGVAFDRMAVLLRSPEEYRPHLQEAFERAGIPAHFARGTVLPDPAGRALLALLHCAADGLSASRFAEYLSLAEVPEPTAAGAPPPSAPAGERWIAPDDELVPEPVAEALDAGTADGTNEEAEARQPQHPRQWEKLLIDAAVIGGRERWERRLDGLQRNLQLRLERTEDDESPEAQRLCRQVEALGRLRDYALPVLDELAALPERAEWGEWLDRLGSLASRSLRHPENVLRVLGELAPLAEVGPVGLEEVRVALSARLLEVSTPPPKSRYGRIFIAPAEAARGLAFDVVFVPGLAEKLFPKSVREEPILLDEVRRKLAAGLATNDVRVNRERFALRLAVGAATRKLVLSYPRIDLEKARPRVPSFYGLEALRAAEGRLPDFEEFAKRAEAAATARIGWPAPARSDDAIDEAEHDLALLESLRGRNESDAAGAARYLVTANPHLGRALRFRARRWLRRWTPPDGLVEPGARAAEALAAHRLDARSYSPTALQHLAVCPYQFFLYAIQRLGPREMPEAIDQMDPLQRGALIHEIQFELFRRLQAENLLPVTAARIEWGRIILDEVIASVAAKHREELAPAIERVWEAGIDDLRADLREWLNRMSEDSSGFVPWRFEHGFGLPLGPERDERSTPEPVALDCGIRLRGSIDLVECRRDRCLRVTDHKTGRAAPDRGNVIFGGKILQPVLYALAAEKLFPKSAVAKGRLWYCTAAGGFEERNVELNATARSRAEAVASTVRQALENGFLPAYPEHGACEYCDYQVICGPYEEMRTRRKPADYWPLEPLVAIRGLS